ncbi:MAG: Rrf2 family transcriptional regulator [candidate division KSB1 bacterium]|nr:Rrf2 family transcriptional regulator [candidate division KSB1 bacterium]MDZ7334467.1 Rrf2 family transcriptional regulator [candidate division KSB1 bacterium]MDZ7355994.1 Rrf2 family transcriptional regulator [candidate division KSB1 bacterium]MDZ7400672.1 Rrf2 family transcriptional regulator [candidate division KSB1 bacterium]
MKLSTRGNYGLRAVYEIARHYGEGPVKIKQISVQQDIPMRYLEQLLLRLKRNGIIRSIRGPAGGYMLSDSPAKLNIGAVLRALEGPLQLAGCAQGADRDHCQRMTDCISHIFWSKVESQLQQLLDDFNLSDLVRLKDEWLASASNGSNCD